MKKYLRNCDKLLLILMVIYSLIGLLMIFSASSVSSVIIDHNSPYHYFLRQIIFVCFSYFIGFIFIMRMPISKYKKLIMPGLIVLFLLLIGLILKGEFINGSKSWYDLGLINFQPSEFVKTVYILYIANFFYSYQKSNEDKGKYYFIRPLIILLILILPILKQPDLGTSVILAGIAGFTILFTPLDKDNKKRLIIIYLIGVILVGGLFYFGKNKFLNKDQLMRLTYKNPCKRYTEATGYQVCNSLIAISNGGLFGVGIGNSTQKYMYLPAAHTDFIFAIIVEELGMIISTFIIIGYMLILWRIYRIAKNADNIRNSIIAFGTLIYMTLHIFINLFGITGMIPLTGVPLPFLSYGGSFNLNLLILLFLIQRVAIENSQSALQNDLRKI